jgi:hypothetical protein
MQVTFTIVTIVAILGSAILSYMSRPPDDPRPSYVSSGAQRRRIYLVFALLACFASIVSTILQHALSTREHSRVLGEMAILQGRVAAQAASFKSSKVYYSVSFADDEIEIGRYRSRLASLVDSYVHGASATRGGGSSDDGIYASRRSAGGRIEQVAIGRRGDSIPAGSAELIAMHLLDRFHLTVFLLPSRLSITELTPFAIQQSIRDAASISVSSRWLDYPMVDQNHHEIIFDIDGQRLSLRAVGLNVYFQGNKSGSIVGLDDVLGGQAVVAVRRLTYSGDAAIDQVVRDITKRVKIDKLGIELDDGTSIRSTKSELQRSYVYDDTSYYILNIPASRDELK